MTRQLLYFMTRQLLYFIFFRCVVLKESGVYKHNHYISYYIAYSSLRPITYSVTLNIHIVKTNNILPNLDKDVLFKIIKNINKLNKTNFPHFII